MTEPTEGQLPAQMDPDLEPNVPDADDAGKGKKNSAEPKIDEAHPENLNTPGF